MNDAKTALVVSIVSAAVAGLAVIVTVAEHFDNRARRKAKVEVKIFQRGYGSGNPDFGLSNDEEPHPESEALAAIYEAEFADQYVFVGVEIRNAGKGIARNIVLLGECFRSGGDSEFAAHVRWPRLLPNASAVGRVRLEAIKGVLVLTWEDDDGAHESEVPLMTKELDLWRAKQR